MATPLPVNPFLETGPFVLDADRFMSDLGAEDVPVFLADPSKEYLDAIDFDAIAEVLTKY